MRDPQSLQQWLQHASKAPAASPLRRVQQLEAINRSLSQWCADPWVGQLRVANLRGDTIVIYSASAAALIPLRQRSAMFLQWLNHHHQLACTRLETRVSPAAPIG